MVRRKFNRAPRRGGTAVTLFPFTPRDRRPKPTDPVLAGPIQDADDNRIGRLALWVPNKLRDDPDFMEILAELLEYVGETGVVFTGIVTTDEGEATTRGGQHRQQRASRRSNRRASTRGSARSEKPVANATTNDNGADEDEDDDEGASW